MNMTFQVSSPIQSEQLHKLGITAKAYFTWMNCRAYNGIWHYLLFQPDFRNELWCVSYPKGMSFHDFGEDNEFAETEQQYPAYTVAKLGILLPPFFPTFVHDDKSFAHCENYRVDTFPLLDSGNEHEDTPAHVLNKELVPIYCTNGEAHARAGMLLHLLEENLVTAEQCNNAFTDFNK